jgi:septin family protein
VAEEEKDCVVLIVDFLDRRYDRALEHDKNLQRSSCEFKQG